MTGKSSVQSAGQSVLAVTSSPPQLPAGAARRSTTAGVVLVSPVPDDQEIWNPNEPRHAPTNRGLKVWVPGHRLVTATRVG